MDDEEGEETGADRRILSQAPGVSGSVCTKGVYSEPVFPFWKQRSVHNRENISPPPSPPKSHPSRTGNDISGTGPTNNHHSCLGDAVHNVKSTTVSRNRASSAICGRDIQSKGTNELGLEHRKAMALERHKRRNLKMQMRGLAADNTVTSTSPSANPKTFSQCQKTVLPSGKPKGCTTTVGHPFCFADPDPSFAARKLHYAKLSPEDRGHLYTVCLSLVSTRCKADLIEKMRAFTLLRTRASITATRVVESLAPSQELGYLRLTYMLERVIRKWQEQRLKVALKAMSRNVVSGSQHKYFVLKRLLRMLLEQLERRKQRAFLGWRMTCLQDTARDAKDEASIMREGYVEKEKAVRHQYSRSLRFTLGICRTLELSRRFKLRILATSFNTWQWHHTYSNRVASALKTCFRHCFAIQQRRALAQWREKVFKKSIGRVMMNHLARLTNATKKDNMYRAMLRWKVRCLSADKLLLSMARKNPLRRHEEFSWLCVLSATRMQTVKLMQEAATVPTPKGGMVKGSSYGTRENGGSDAADLNAGPWSIAQDSSRDGDGVTSNPMLSSSGEIQAMTLSQTQVSDDGLRAQLSTLAISTAASSFEIFPGLPPHERGDIMTPSTSRLTHMFHPKEGGGSDVSDLGYSMSPPSEAISFFKLSTDSGSKRGECSPPDRLFSGAVRSSSTINGGILDVQQSSSTSDPSFMHPSPPSPEDGKLGSIVQVSPPTEMQQRKLLFHEYAAEMQHEDVEASLVASTSSFLQVSTSSAGFPETSMAVGPSLSPEKNGGTPSGRSLFSASPVLLHPSEEQQPNRKNEEHKLLNSSNHHHLVTAIHPYTSDDYSPAASVIPPPQLLTTTNPLSRPHGIDHVEAAAAAAPAIRAKKSGGENNLANAAEEPISPLRAGIIDGRDSDFELLPDDHPGNLSAVERGARRPLQHDTDGDNTNMVTYPERTEIVAAPVNIQQPFERTHDGGGGANGPRWYSYRAGDADMQQPRQQEVVAADSAVGPPPDLRSEENQGILRRREDVTTQQYDTINMEPAALPLSTSGERSSYPNLNNHQLKYEGHANQAIVQDPQVSLSCCTKLIPEQQHQLSLHKTVVLPEHVISPDRARNELPCDDYGTRDAIPLLCQQNEAECLSCHTFGYEQPPQGQTGHSAAASLPSEYVPSFMVPPALPEYECDESSKVGRPQHKRGTTSALFNADDELHFQHMTANHDNLSTLPAQCGPFQPSSDVVFEVQNKPYNRSNCNDELQHSQGIGVLKQQQQQEEYYHPEGRYDLVQNNNVHSSTVREPQYCSRRDCDDALRLEGALEVKDEYHERRRREVVDDNVPLLHEQQRRYHNQSPKGCHEQHIQRRFPKPEQQYRQERGRNVEVSSCNPNPLPPLTAQEHQFHHDPMRSHHNTYGSRIPEPGEEYPVNRRSVVVNNDSLMEQEQEQYYHHGPKRNHEHITQRTATEPPQPAYCHDKRCTSSKNNNPVPPLAQERQHYSRITNHDQHVAAAQSFSEQQPEEYYVEKRFVSAAAAHHDLPMAQEQHHHHERRKCATTICNNNISHPEEEEHCYRDRKNNYEPQRNGDGFTEQQPDEYPYPERRFVIVSDGEFPVVPEQHQQQQYHHGRKSREPQSHGVLVGPPDYHERRRNILDDSNNDYIPNMGQQQGQQIYYHPESNYDGHTRTERYPESSAEHPERRYAARGKNVVRSGVRPTPPPGADRLWERGFSRATGMQQQRRRRIIIREGTSAPYNEDRIEDSSDWVAEDVRGDSVTMQHAYMNPPVAPCRPRQGAPCEGGRRKGRNRYARGGPSQKYSNGNTTNAFGHSVQNKGRYSSSHERNGHHHRDAQLDVVADDEDDQSQYTVCDDLESEESASSLPLPPACDSGSNTHGRRVEPDAAAAALDYVQGDRETAKTLHEKLNALESGLEHVEASMSTSPPHISVALSKKNSKEIQQRLSAVEMAVDGLRKGAVHDHVHSSVSPAAQPLFEHGGVFDRRCSASAAADINNNGCSSAIGSAWASDVKEIRHRLKKARSRLEVLQMEAEAFSSETTPSLKNHVLRNQRNRLNNALNMALGSSCP